jgi:cobalt-zinc-cadmium resistance protein CzcA
MFDNIIAYSVRNKFVIGLFTAALALWGIYSLKQIPIDAVPDITNNQVQIITISPTLATQEIEQFITTPIELSLQNLQRIEEIRSISRFGLSVITVVFDESYDIYLARQLVNEALSEAQSNIPDGLGAPEMAPLSTGLGEIYQYVVRPTEGFEDKYDAIELRSIQDWIVKRQLSGIEGVAEINSMGGYLKQYQVAVDPLLLKSYAISMSDIFNALELSNENTGGAYIEKNPNTYYIRAEGLAKSKEDIERIVVKLVGSSPLLIKDVASVQIGKAPRYGALVRNGKEVVGGKVMMFKGANSAAVTEIIRDRVIQIQKSLPEGVVIEPYLVRDKLVSTAMSTVKTNLLEGGLIVIFILVLLLGNWRAGLIVASVIPLAMLFAIAMMNVLGISANLMSLGAIDFGLIVDGAVIIVEAIVHRLSKFGGQKLTTTQMNDEVIESSQKIRSSAAFGEIIILMVYIPILALVGIEGKMFKPMAETVMLAIGGALILSLTYVPMMVALFLKKDIIIKRTIADRIIEFFQRIYTPVLNLALRLKMVFVLGTTMIFLISIYSFSKMGGEFIPTLEEGDLAMQHILPPGSSLSQSVETAKMVQLKLLKEFHEIEDIVVNIGSAEIPTDPMPVEIGDYALIMKPKSEWTAASTRKGMFEKLEESLHDIPGIGYEFSQPIQLRFNELMTGAKADIAIKLYGDDLDVLYNKAKEAEKSIVKIDGVGTVNVEQTIGMPQIIVNYDYAKMAQYGLHIKEVNKIIRTAFAGEKAGVIYEGEKRFDLVVKYNQSNRKDISDVQNLFINLDNGSQIPLSSVANIELIDAPMQISRENTNRRIVIGVNVGNTDVESLVTEIQATLDSEVTLPSGYYFTYGGQFENLKAANARLMVAVPLALALIFILLFFTFGSVSQAALIFVAIPLSAIGGIWALQLRGMPFSISAGIGFIALFGVAVLNGIVLIGYFNQLKAEGMTDLKSRILTGTEVRLRPVLMTALVASLGFLPMALSSSGGAEVQRPLATVVIGGLLSATILTLIILPILYSWLERWSASKAALIISKTTTSIIFILFMSFSSFAQQSISLDDAIKLAVSNHPSIASSNLAIEKNTTLTEMGYTLGTTDISYQGDGLFRENGQRVNQLGIIQNIPNPLKISSIRNLNNKVLMQSEVDQLLTIAEVKLAVRQSYYQVQYLKGKQTLYSRLIVLYEQYLTKAKVRVSSGAANKLEMLNIESKLNEYNMLQKQIMLEIPSREQQLNLLLNTDQEYSIIGSLEQEVDYDNTSAENLWMSRSKLETEIKKAEIDVISSNVKPDFNLGYALQNYTEGGWLHGIQAGVSLPLFTSNNNVKVEAKKLEVAQYLKEVEATQLRLDSKLLESKKNIAIYEQGALFYKDQLQSLAPQLQNIANINYKTGTLSYLELLNVLNITAEYEIEFLTQLYQQKLAISTYQYLINQ